MYVNVNTDWYQELCRERAKTWLYANISAEVLTSLVSVSALLVLIFNQMHHIDFKSKTFD